MKRWLALLAFCLCNVVFADPIVDRRIDPAALEKLCIAMGIPTDKNLICETQRLWRRKPGQERWELTEINPDQRLFVLNWAKEQGLYAKWRPSCKVYDKALILGANTSRMQTRLEFLKQLWVEGVRFNEIVWLTGDRPLNRTIDYPIEGCLNESQAAKAIWKSTDLPDEMRCLPVVFIAVPLKEEGKRPNTEDTIIEWIKNSPEPCKAMFVSDQPFCGYQFAVIKSNLPKEFLFDVVGKEADPSTHPAAAAITLDCVASWIYQESVGKN